MDEAMHPLALLCFGMYGEVLPNQDGAPLRMVMPWKYGFKSIKSIVRIRFIDSQPDNTWHSSAPSEYGFYSNVNPQCGPSALEPGHGTPLGRISQAANLDVQRLRSGGVAVFGHGFEEKFLELRVSKSNKSSVIPTGAKRKRAQWRDLLLPGHKKRGQDALATAGGTPALRRAELFVAPASRRLSRGHLALGL